MYIFDHHRKFIPETNDKGGKGGKTSSEEKKNEPGNCFYVQNAQFQNILNPSNKIQCDTCKRDVSKTTKVLADDCDYCVGCFSALEDFPEQYHVINKLDFPLFDVEWTADEELLLFEGLEKYQLYKLGTALGTGDKLLILSVRTKPGKTFRSTIRLYSSKPLNSFQLQQ